MFDIGFSELGLIAVIGLLVLGPERLPRVARTAGALMRRARSSWQSVRDEIERELAAEDIKRNLQDVGRDANALRHELETTANTIAAPKAPDAPAESGAPKPPRESSDEQH